MEPTKEQNPKASSATTRGDGGEAEIQHAFDVANAQGFFGTEVDPTPNEAYTLQGGPAGEGTPEADPKAAAKARTAIAEASGRG